MSITFSIQGAEYENITPYADEPDYEVAVPVEPYSEINLSNGNAADFLALIDPDTPFDYCGKWEVAKLPALLASIENLLTTNGKDALVTDTVRDGNIVYCGRPDDYVLQRLQQFHKLVKVAHELGREIYFG